MYSASQLAELDEFSISSQTTGGDTEKTISFLGTVASATAGCCSCFSCLGGKIEIQNFAALNGDIVEYAYGGTSQGLVAMICTSRPLSYIVDIASCNGSGLNCDEVVVKARLVRGDSLGTTTEKFDINNNCCGTIIPQDVLAKQEDACTNCDSLLRLMIELVEQHLMQP